MTQNRIKQIRNFGQNIWLDYLDREILDSGKLKGMMEDDGISGITSNPSIFEQAISKGSNYDKDIVSLSRTKRSYEVIYFSLAVKDIQTAADLFDPIYKTSNGQDGFVSIEVSPRLAHNTEGTISQAKELWRAVHRKNVMIKIPATIEGLPAIRKCISEGINVNITLLFGLPRYREVVEAYLSGLEDRLKNGRPIAQIRSVASFFLSRIDVMIDPELMSKGLSDLKGQVAVASAKMAYKNYKEIFSGERFKDLGNRGAKQQYLLWASTTTKDPDFSDVKYVASLIGPETINTVTLETLDAFRDHGKADNRLETDMDKAAKILTKLIDNDIDLDAISQNLEAEGIEKFNKAYDKILEVIKKRRIEQMA